jgi:N-acetylmuramoyl-L-alanine amidase
MDILTSLLYLTLNVYFEARGEYDIGQKAVVHVTVNRSKKRNQNIKYVVLDPYQFSWTHQLDSYNPKDLKAFLTCLENVLIALNEEDFTQGATFYHHESIDPYWAKSFKFVNQWGQHKFYKKI